MLKVFALACLSVASSQTDEYDKAFADYVKRFSKEYVNKEHVSVKFGNFKQNYIFISRENQKGTNKYTLGVNEFTDMSPEHFRSTHNGYIKPKQNLGNASNLGTIKYDGRDLPDSVDWNAKGAVTPVKNQNQCGSCWSFSTTGALEGAWFVATGKLVSLSEEQLVECSTENSGCQGGSMQKAFEFEEGVDVCTEDSYPYTSGSGDVGSCHSSGCSVGIPKGGVTGYQAVTQNDMNAMMQAVSTQPVSIAVEADQPFWQHYQSGVMTDTCGTQLDHGILCVGYGTDNGTEYWLVKNSWGTTWGINGFAKLQRGKGGAGECGILMGANVPQVKQSANLIV